MDSSYTIIIKYEPTQSENPIAGNNGASEDTSSNASNETTQSSSDRTKALKGIIAVKGIVAPIANQVVTHYISTVSLRTGAVEQQERLSFAYSMGKQIANIGLSTLAGLAVGKAPGAIIGAALGLANAAISYGTQAKQIDLNRNVENVGLRFMNARVGGSVASFSGSRMKRQ